MLWNDCLILQNRQIAPHWRIQASAGTVDSQ
jgi:hypothetical protein